MRRPVLFTIIALALITSRQLASAFVLLRFYASSSFRRTRGSTQCRRQGAQSALEPSTCKRRKCSVLASTLSDEEWSPIEIWLDLRGTAITPRMALSKLQEDAVLPVSMVIVSTQVAARAVQQWEPGDPDIILVDESDSSLCNAKDPCIRYGMVVTVEGDSFVDPMPALQTATKGGWVLVDPEGGSDKMTERHEAIANLVAFICGGMSLDSFSLGECESSANDANDSPPFDTEIGGIAIACETNADLIQAANSLQTVDLGTLTTTESGILIKSDPAEGSLSQTKSLHCALAIPFDLPLWKQAALLVMDEIS